ncbi:MAG: serine/threonine-protein kinase [Caldisericia bacterium]
MESLSETRVASVYSAIDLQIDKKVVVKLVSGGSSNIESQKVKRFLSEIALLQTLSHPGVIKVFDNGQDGGDLFYVMEYIPGKSLSPGLNLTLESFVDVFLDISEIIGYLHSKGIIHRDIKPSNIMVLPKKDENGKIAKIIDYGLAKFSEDGRITSQGMIVGTLNFMAPELLLEYGVDVRSDFYSLGASMFYVLTKRFPFEVTDLKKVAFGVNDETAYDFSNSSISIPKSLSNLIVKLLSKDMDERPAKIEEVIDVLQSIKTENVSKEYDKSISISEPELIGRDWEIRNILKIWDESTSSKIVMVRSPFGLGKSRLLEEISLRLFLNRNLVIRARGVANSVSYDGSGLIQIIFELSQLNPDYTKFLGYKEVLSSIDDRLKERYLKEITSAIMDFAKSLKEKIAFVIDDFHLFDSISMNALLNMIDGLDNIFLLTSSDVTADDYFSILDLQRKIEYFDLVPMEGLTYIKFIQACVGSKNLPADLYFDLIKYCKGNPFFTLELFRLMVQEEIIFFDADFVRYEANEEIFSNPDYLPSIGVSLMGISDKAMMILEFLALSSSAISGENIEKSIKISDSDTLVGLEELKGRGLVFVQKRGLSEKFAFNIEILRTLVIARISEEVKSMMELEHAKRILESKVVDSKLVFDVGLHFIKAGEQYRSVAYFIHYLWYQVFKSKISQIEINAKIAEIKPFANFMTWQLIQDIADSMYLCRIAKSKEANVILGKYRRDKSTSFIIAGIVLVIVKILSGELDGAKKIIKELTPRVRSTSIDEFRTQLFYARAMINMFECNVIGVRNAITKAREFSLKTGGYNTIGISKIMVNNLIDLYIWMRQRESLFLWRA